MRGTSGLTKVIAVTLSQTEMKERPLIAERRKNCVSYIHKSYPR